MSYSDLLPIAPVNRSAGGPRTKEGPAGVVGGAFWAIRHRGWDAELAAFRPGGYCWRVRKSVMKPLVFLLVAAQLLLAVPAMAFAQGTSATAESSPCDEMMSSTTHD